MNIPKRSVLDAELEHLTANLLKMASLVDSAIEKSMRSLENRDLALADEVILADGEINATRYLIEETSLRVLATQHPLAIDLRRVIASIHLAVELERMGDHASGISRIVKRMASEDEIISLFKLPKMAKRARKMLHEGMEAYINQDVELAQKMVKRDEKMDRQYQSFFRETLVSMEDDAYVRRATFLLWVSHNLERIGDRATNIAERVVFMVTGQFVESYDDLDGSLYITSDEVE
ncbi:MAG: phosphate signaling complex protein PhoU [Chloroflexota bacterium]